MTKTIDAATIPATTPADMPLPSVECDLLLHKIEHDMSFDTVNVKLEEKTQKTKRLTMSDRYS